MIVTQPDVQTGWNSTSAGRRWCWKPDSLYLLEHSFVATILSLFGTRVNLPPMSSMHYQQHSEIDDRNKMIFLTSEELWKELCFWEIDKNFICKTLWKYSFFTTDIASPNKFIPQAYTYHACSKIFIYYLIVSQVMTNYENNQTATWPFTFGNYMTMFLKGQ
jgi:hypothetical protein